MDIGRLRRTIYIEPIEEPQVPTIEEPSPECDPLMEPAPEEEPAVR